MAYIVESIEFQTTHICLHFAMYEYKHMETATGEILPLPLLTFLQRHSQLLEQHAMVKIYQDFFK